MSEMGLCFRHNSKELLIFTDIDTPMHPPMSPHRKGLRDNLERLKKVKVLKSSHRENAAGKMQLKTKVYFRFQRKTQFSALSWDLAYLQ